MGERVPWHFRDKFLTPEPPGPRSLHTGGPNGGPVPESWFARGVLFDDLHAGPTGRRRKRLKRPFCRRSSTRPIVPGTFRHDGAR